jgi:hypothetical protein
VRKIRNADDDIYQALIDREVELWHRSYLTLYYHFKIWLFYRILSYTFLIILLIFAMDFPAGRGAIISQFRVWPFPSTLIMTSGERNRNPGHHFAGI